MADYLNEAVAALKQTAEALIQANQGIVRAAEAVLAAKDQHEDLRETVHRLESLVMDLTREVRELRQRGPH